MTQPAPNLTESLNLLPTVLQNIKALRKKPELATDVFSAVRKESQNAKAHAFFAPLLAQITAALLSTGSLNFRYDAAKTCVALLRALVNRRVSGVATAYFLDLVNLADRLVKHDGSTPFLCQFPLFSEAAHNAASSPEETERLRSARLPYLRDIAMSLHALLQLLTHFVPSTAPYSSPSLNSTPGTSGTQSAPQPPFEDVAGTSVRLWIGIGARARSSILNLAASHMLLSGSCGPLISEAAAQLLEQLCDSGTGCAMPHSIREKVTAVVCSVLEDTHGSSDEMITPKARIALYTLSQKASLSHRIPSRLWSNHGIQDAVRGLDTVSLPLRGLSQYGLATLCVDGQRSGVRRHEVFEPPRKKRRLGSGKGHKSEVALHPALSQIQQFSGAPVEGFEGLKQVYRILESDCSFLDQHAAVRLLSRTCRLIERSMSVSGGSIPLSQSSLTQWISFVFTLSSTLCEALKRIPWDSSTRFLHDVLGLVAACIRLISSLFCTLDNQSKRIPLPFALRTAAVEVSQAVVQSAISVLCAAAGSLKERPQDFPVQAYAKALCALKEAPMSQESDVFKCDELVKIFDELQAFVLKSRDSVQEKLLPVAFLFGCFLMGSTGNDTNPLVKLCNLVEMKSMQSTPALCSAIYALSDATCNQAKCCANHREEIVSCNASVNSCSSIERGIWVRMFDLLDTLQVSSSDYEASLAKAYVLGVLVLHAPEADRKRGVSRMSELLWHSDIRIRWLSFKFLSFLFTHSTMSTTSFSSREGAQGVPLPSLTQTGKQDAYDFNGILQRIGADIQKPVVDMEEQPISELLPMEMVGLASFGMVISSANRDNAAHRGCGLAISSLLRRSASELESSFSSSNAVNISSSPEHINQSAVLYQQLKTPAWTESIMVLSPRGPDVNRSFDIFWTHGERVCSSPISPTHGFISKESFPSLSLMVARKLNRRLGEWAPHLVHDMLGEESVANRVVDILGDRSSKTFWKKLPRHVVGFLLKNRNLDALENLASKLGIAKEDLVDKVCADVLARAAIEQNRVPDDKLWNENNLISDILKTPLAEIVSRRAGKIVQKLIMEFGSCNEEKAQRSLISLSSHMRPADSHKQSQKAVGSMLGTHFMLVMDAVMRGLFHSKAPEGERHRYLHILRKVLYLASDHLHLFVSKIVASLKISLDESRGSECFRIETVRTWDIFLRTLGPERVSPHLGMILAILIPLFHTYESFMSPTILNLISESVKALGQDRSPTAFLLRVTDHPALNRVAAILDERSLTHPLLNSTKGNFAREPTKLTIREIADYCDNVEIILSQHENGAIEILAAERLLQILRSNRRVLDAGIAGQAGFRDVLEDTASKTLTSMLTTLVAQLQNTSNEVCQELLLQCIGEIGAIDPVLIAQVSKGSSEVPLSREEVMQTYPQDVHALIAHLLDSHLVPTLAKGEGRDSSNNRLNRIGLVIQELLRVAGCGKETANRTSRIIEHERTSHNSVLKRGVVSGGSRDNTAFGFWESLLSSTRNAVQPYLAEPFDVQQYQEVFGGNAGGDTVLACEPVWMKVKAASDGLSATAQEWRRQIVVQLVDFIGKRGAFGETLRALRPVLRYEDPVTELIFPLAFTIALDLQHAKGSCELEEFLVSEVAEVLREGTSPQPVFDLFDTLRSWRDVRCEQRGRMRQNAKVSGSAGSHEANVGGRKRAGQGACIEAAKDEDPLSMFVDLFGREAESLSLIVQARAAFQARSYFRCIMLSECHIRNMRNRRGFSGWPSYIDMILGKEGQKDSSDKTPERESLNILQKSFSALEHPENMIGIAALRSTSTLAEALTDSEAAGRYDNALTIYERSIAEQPRSASLHEGFLECLMTLGHWETMLSHSEGLIASSNLHETNLRYTARAHGASAAWRLGRWDKVEDMIPESNQDSLHRPVTSSSRSWALNAATSFGRMILSLREGNSQMFKAAAFQTRQHLLFPIIRAAQEGYARAYPLIVMLHSLADVEDAFNTRLRLQDLDETSLGQEVLQTRLIGMKGRTGRSSSSLKVREPILSTKRVCYELLGMPNEATTANVELANLARQSGNLQAASGSAFRAVSATVIRNDVLNSAVVETAHIRRAQGDMPGALSMVKKEIDRLLQVWENRHAQESQQLPASETADRLCTAYVMAGGWIEESRSEPSETVVSFYQDASRFGPNREEPFYALGRHYDSLLQAAASSESKDVLGELPTSRASRRSPGSQQNQYVPMIIKSFTSALVNGHSRIFEALPRMLTIWFDYHTDLNDPEGMGGAMEYQDVVAAEIAIAFERIPSYMWMTAVPQLISRILHPRQPVKEAVMLLLAKLIRIYPDESFWTILPSSQLNAQQRKQAASDVLNLAVLLEKRGKSGDAREKAKLLRARIQSALVVVQSFVAVCLNLLPKDRRGKKENCSKEFRSIRTHLKSCAVANAIIPTLRSLTVQLPRSAHGVQHRPFDMEPIRIVDIEDHVLVMSSLMRPRRIGLIGSDGLHYRYLAKRENQGDMRKDSRLVEFITVVNRLLSKDVESHKRNLELKTYAVLPLTEETGMIEWVNDLAALRNVVREEQLRVMRVPDTSATQRAYQSTEDKRKFLEEWAFVKFPCVLDRFFVQTFGGGSDAQGWLAARNLWTESTAVWSMSGYVVGLGDRHGENVLLETTSGRCVHVDFAMLFDKGQKLKVPEIVPFRLTRNMVTAMGIAGYEGVYRCVCEKVLGIMRKNSDALLGVLESFLYDPLADWGKDQTKGGGGGAMVSKEARRSRAAVKAKLTGLMDGSGLALSIVGQVERLIREATSVDNLSEMYVWWSSWV